MSKRDCVETVYPPHHARSTSPRHALLSGPPLSAAVAYLVADLRWLRRDPAVLFVVGDDVGYSDFGYFNDQKTITPTVDKLLATGIHLTDYCEPLPPAPRPLDGNQGAH